LSSLKGYQVFLFCFVCSGWRTEESGTSIRPSVEDTTCGPAPKQAVVLLLYVVVHGGSTVCLETTNGRR
jgi:hypothetical protein